LEFIDITRFGLRGLKMTAEDDTPKNAHPNTDLPMPADQIQEQLRRILASPVFRATEAQRAFLQFVVEKVLAGESEDIKGYTVATRVFGRREDFDQATDPIVSIQANKLRRALEHYYLVAGKQDPIRIDIPKGTYIPSFTERVAGSLAPAFGRSGCKIDRFEGAWPAVVIRPFQNLTGDPDLEYMAIGLATELAMEITRFQDIRVLIRGPADRGRREADSGARFAIDGSIRKDSVRIKVAIQLIDLTTCIQIWADRHESELEAARVIAFQEHVARVVAAKICGEFGIIARAMSIESKNVPPSDLKTYEAILRYYAFNANFSAKTFFNALAALKLAVDQEPEKGIVWSMLARLYATNYGLDLFDVDTPLEDAVTFAEKGVRLDPANQRVRGIMGYVMFLKNDLLYGLAEAERAISLNPNSLIMMANLGYLLTLLGDWERGPALIRKAIENNPYYDVIVHYALWADWIRRGDDENAYAETLHFKTPLLFWDPLMKAITLGLLERIDDGKQAVEDLLKLKPDFPTRGRALIKRYIKFDNVLERTIEGLSKVGIIIE
jgi:adenylate cyclase